MPSRDTASVLETIAANVDLARRFIEGLSREDFLVDVRTQYAVTRCLEMACGRQYGSNSKHLEREVYE